MFNNVRRTSQTAWMSTICFFLYPVASIYRSRQKRPHWVPKSSHSHESGSRNHFTPLEAASKDVRGLNARQPGTNHGVLALAMYGTLFTRSVSYACAAVSSAQPDASSETSA